MSASVFFASEYLVCVPVDPSFAIAKSIKRPYELLTNFKPPTYDATYITRSVDGDEKKDDKDKDKDKKQSKDNKDKDDKKQDARKKLQELSDDAKKSILLHWKQAPTALHHVKEHHEAQSKGEIIKRQSTYISRDDNEHKDDDDDTFFEKVGHWFDNLGKKIEKEAEKLKDEVFKPMKDAEVDVYKDAGKPTYYEYYLCTNKYPHGNEKDRVAFVNKHTLHSNNIYYVPALVGQYPWYVSLYCSSIVCLVFFFCSHYCDLRFLCWVIYRKNYKEFVMNVFKANEQTAEN